MKDIVLNIEKDKKDIILISEALSSENRLIIIEEVIRNRGQDSHKSLAEKLGIKSSSITFHLSSLISAGILTEEEEKNDTGRKAKKPKINVKRVIIEL